MQNTAHRAIDVRLNKWVGAFNTGQWPDGWATDCPPSAHIDSEYDYDVLADQARDSGQPHLIELAELVQLMAANYMQRMDNDMFDALMRDDEPQASVRKLCTGQRVTVADIDAIQNLNNSRGLASPASHAKQKDRSQYHAV